jgi:hypothetical protein
MRIGDKFCLIDRKERDVMTASQRMEIASLLKPVASTFNRIPVMAPILAPIFGVLFYRGVSPSKIGLSAPSSAFVHICPNLSAFVRMSAFVRIYLDLSKFARILLELN